MALLDDTRADWDARPPLWDGFPHVAPSKRAGRMWHWNGPAVNIGGRDHSACLAAVRGDQAFHQDVRRWSDVGYNALICPHGRAVEGAGIDKAAAHCKGYNTSHYGIQLMVGQGEHPTPAMLARAVRLSSDLRSRSGHTLEDLGHRDGFATQCPGDEIYAWVRAGGPTHAGTSGSVGSAGSTPVGGSATGTTQQEDDMPYTPDDLAAIVQQNVKTALIEAGKRATPADRQAADALRAIVASAASPAVLAQSIAANLPATGGQPITDAQLERVLRTVLGSVDEGAAK